jgi:uncharacterized membrane protein YbhN (UPF0104 family)
LHRFTPEFLRYALSLAVLAVAAYVLSTLADPGQVASILLRVDLAAFGLATAVFYATFLAQGARWRVLLGGIGVGVPALTAAVLVFLGWFVNVIVPARVGDIYRCILAESASGCSKLAALGTVASERTIDLVVLAAGVTAGTSVYLARMTVLRDQLLALSVGLLLLVGIGVGTVLLVLPRFLGDRFELLSRFRSGFRWIRSWRSAVKVAGFTLAIWTLNVLRLWLVTVAIGAPLDFILLVFVALLIGLLSGIPVTPAGLGIVELVSTSVLIGAAVPGSVGVSIVLLDRLITVGGVLLVGAPLYLIIQHRDEWV